MLIKPTTGFVYPVLSEHTSDYRARNFEVELLIEETPTNGEVSIAGSASIDDPEINHLIAKQVAGFAISCECRDTYFENFTLQDPAGFSLRYPPGTLRGRVAVQAMVVALRDDIKLISKSIVQDYPEHTRVLSAGDFAALSRIHTFEAGMDKLVPMESIFRLLSDPDMESGYFRVNTDAESIEIHTPRALYDVIYRLRGTRSRDVLLPALFLPVVMSVLDMMGEEDFSDRRWYQVIKSRLNNDGISVKSDGILRAAQELLAGPLARLEYVFMERE